ncbi:MAG: trehalose/maltose hydrolase or phosphorylase, partial [Daejeonella sp.]|nr:trehalose/maltose hydrolase or phosphorylase [Daejeonella sp.]
YSPENNPSNGTSQAAINATMDVMIARQLLRNCIAAAKALNIDQTEVNIWEKMLLKLPEYKVAKDGTLREWLWPDLEENHKHRHSSQLYALFDVEDPLIINYPRLVKAVNRTIDEKMKFRIEEDGGEMSFGLVQLGLAAAHIGEAEKANQIIKWLSSKYWSTGMGSYHNVGNLFNTDISGGLPAVIIQMLAYSEPGLVSLIPALPKEWNKGKIEGLLLRGQIQVKSLSWNGKHVEVVMKSAVAQNIDLKFPKSIESISADRIKKAKYPAHPERYMLSLPAQEEVKIVVDLE